MIGAGDWPGTRHRNLDRPEGAGQRPRPAPVPMARDTGSSFAHGEACPTVTRTREGRVELLADQLFDELPSPIPHLGLDRVEPVVEKLGSRLDFTLREIGLPDSLGHGVVSGPALQRRMIRG